MDETVTRCAFPTDRAGSRCGARVARPSEVGLAGRRFQVDLCPQHQPHLAAALQVFLAIGRPVTPTGRDTRWRAAAMRGKGAVIYTSADVRAHFRAQGRDLPATGRLPHALIAEYRREKGI